MAIATLQCYMFLYSSFTSHFSVPAWKLQICRNSFSQFSRPNCRPNKLGKSEQSSMHTISCREIKSTAAKQEAFYYRRLAYPVASNASINASQFFAKFLIGKSFQFLILICFSLLLYAIIYWCSSLCRFSEFANQAALPVCLTSGHESCPRPDWSTHLSVVLQGVAVKYGRKQ